MFRLRLFGGASILGPTGPLAGPPAQQRRLAALALLAASPTGAMSRDKLLALLWPEKDTARARHRLADAVYALRMALGDHAIRHHGGELALDRSVVSSDVEDFRVALIRKDHAEAVSLYGGPFLDGFFVKDAPEFERWTEATRSRLARDLAAGIEELAAQSEARGDRSAAVRWWRELVALNPYGTPGVLRLMQVLVAGGDRAGAVAQARSYATGLREQLGVEPDPAVISFAERLTEPPDRLALVRSVAVLPFENIGGDEADAYVADGVAEELIYALSRLPGLRVLARTSSFAFKGRNDDIREIGRILGVAAVLEGSIRRQGQQFRITLRLVDTATARHLWSERYDRATGDMLRLQEEIAGAVAHALEIRLPAGRADPRASGQPGAEAHDRYLKGRYLLNTRTRDGMLKAVDCFERAAAYGPGYARAHAGLAEAHLMLGSANHGVLAPREAVEQARRSAERALSLDEALVDAHVSLGIACMHTWRWSDALGHLRRALELDPCDAAAHHRFGWLLAIGGDLDGALAEVRRAEELDPLSLPIRCAVGRVHEFTGRIDDAIVQYRRSLEVDPSFSDAYCGLGTAYLKKGLHLEAVAALRRAHDLGRTPGLEVLLAFGLAVAGEHEAARTLVRQVLGRTRPEHAPAAHIGDVSMALGDVDQGFAWYEAAYEQQSPTLMYLEVDPMWRPMREDPRWRDLVRRVGRPDVARKTVA